MAPKVCERTILARQPSLGGSSKDHMNSKQSVKEMSFPAMQPLGPPYSGMHE